MAVNQAKVRRIELGAIVVCLFLVGLPLVGMALASVGFPSGVAKLMALGLVGVTTALGVLRGS